MLAENLLLKMTNVNDESNSDSLTGERILINSRLGKEVVRWKRVHPKVS